MKIKIAIAGYGNLGRGVENAVNTNDDMELVALFTRRDPTTIKTASNIPVYSIDDAEKFKNDIDVLILCGGSANDLPLQTPSLAKHFNVVDSFDTHAKIPEHFSNVNNESIKAKKVAIISVGWDPGMFSLNRLYAEAILPNGNTYTFWGKGISQGHSDAIRRIEGVKDARQYTIPVESALDSVRKGENPVLSTRQKHLRECFVVAKDGADKQKIEQTIINMPNYFADYDTTVHFISEEELQMEHSVMHSGVTGKNGENKHLIEYKLTLDSNPEFTSSVLVAYARAAYRLNKQGDYGCKTVFDIAPKYLHPESNDKLREKLL